MRPGTALTFAQGPRGGYVGRHVPLGPCVAGHRLWRVQHGDGVDGGRAQREAQAGCRQGPGRDGGGGPQLSVMAWAEVCGTPCVGRDESGGRCS